MKLINPRTAHVLKNPVAFALQVLRAFKANQGLLLAGAVAYYALLSIVPLLILVVIALSQVIGQEVLLATIRRGLDYAVPGAGNALAADLGAFLAHGKVIGLLLVITLLFFSQLGFKVLENAISVIFLHRVTVRRRHFAASLLLPFGYIAFIGVMLLAASFVFADLMSIGASKLVLLGHSWSLSGVARVLIYAAGFVAEMLLISAIYYFMPVGRLPARHALIGGATVAALWEIISRTLGWYFSTLSQVNLVYGSLTSVIIVLLSLEVAATLLLLGAQAIAEYENIGAGGAAQPHEPMRTDAV